MYPHLGDFNKNAAKVYHWGSNFKLLLCKYLLHFVAHQPSNFMKLYLVKTWKTWVLLEFNVFIYLEDFFLH